MEALRKKTWDFLEAPSNRISQVVFWFLMVLAIISVVPILVEHFFFTLFAQNRPIWLPIEAFCVGIFTVEYVVKIWAAPNRWKYIFSFDGLIDLLSILPFFLEHLVFNQIIHDLNSLRLLRTVRLLRLVRLLKLLRAFRFLQVQNTIVEQVAPVMLAFVFFKTGVIVLEAYEVLRISGELKELFGVVGFALGITLGQNVRMAYIKFVRVEESALRLHAYVMCLYGLLNFHPETRAQRDAVLWRWLEALTVLLERNPSSSRKRFYSANRELFELGRLVADKPSFLYSQFGRDFTRLNIETSYLFNRMDSHIPLQLTRLLQRTTLIYLILLALFVPGFSGLLSVMVATYMLYGLYQVALDLDVAIADKNFGLMSVNIDTLKTLHYTLFYQDIYDQMPPPDLEEPDV